MKIFSFSEARNALKTLCDGVIKSRKPARIKRRGGDVVVVSAEDWDSLQETLYIMSIPGAVERIKNAGDYRELKPVTREALEKLIAEAETK
jgi:prevent-host-death family protein